MHNRIRRYFIIILIAIGIVIMPSTKASAGWVDIGGWSNDGSSRAQSMNGKYGVPGYWGSYTTDAIMQSPDEAMLWGRDRRISFPVVVTNDREWKFTVFAVGYADGLDHYQNQPDAQLILQYCTDSSQNWITFDYPTIHGWVDGNVPTYDKQLNKQYDIPASQIWGVRCITEDYCLDRFDVHIQKDDYPIHDWSVPTNAAYVSENNYWYKVNSDISLQTTYEDSYANLMNIYGYLVDASKNDKIAMGISASGTPHIWLDGIDSSIFYDYRANWVAGWERQRHVNYTIKSSKEINMEYKTNAINVVGGWENSIRTQALHIDSENIVRTDGTAPINEGIEISSNNVEGVGFEISGVEDLDEAKENEGSGVKKVSVVLFPEKDSSYKGSDEWIEGEYDPTTKTIIIDEVTYDGIYDGIYGKYKAQFCFEDNVGNKTYVEKTINRIDPIPKDGVLEVCKYDYKKNNNYWVKAGTPFAIYTEAYMNKEYEAYPSETSVLFLENANEIKNRYIQHMMGIDYSNLNYFDDVENTAVDYIEEEYIDEEDLNLIKSLEASLSEGYRGMSFSKAGTLEDGKNNRNYLKGMHWLTSNAEVDQDGNPDLVKNADGHKFKLYSSASYKYNSIFNYDEIISSSVKKDSMKWIYIDGTAPTGNVEMKPPDSNLNIAIDVTGVVDKDITKIIDGSGVKEIYTRYYPSYGDQYYEEHGITDDMLYEDLENKSYKISKKQDLIYDSGNGRASGVIDTYKDFNCDDITVEVWAVDNVGNEKQLGDSMDFELFTVKARIVPYNKLDWDETKVPKIQEGQYGKLIITTTGGPTKLDIDFPYELEEYVAKEDPVLDLWGRGIPEKPLYIYEYDFKVPLYVPEDEYTVDITAIKKNNEKDTTAKFIVGDNVLSGVRTRIR